MSKTTSENTVVITGANRGIGLAMTKICQQRGDNVYALCRQPSAQLTALNVETNNTIHIVDGVDIATEVGINIALAELVNVNIDLLINNAGILRDESLVDLNATTISEQFNVNALAPLLFTHALLSKLSKGSKVAMITSRMGSVADNSSGGRYGYRMSKAALNIAAVSLARDLAPLGISVGIYHPGYVQTDMVNVAGMTTNGEISSDVAASRLLGLMADLSLNNSGVFKHSNGETLPW